MKLENVQKALEVYATEVISNAKKNLVDDRKSLGDLYSTLNYNLETEVDAFLVQFLMEDYGMFVDRGVEGKTSTYPETAAAQSDMAKKFHYGSGNFAKGGLTKGINEWLTKKRFQWRTKDGKFMSYQSMTFIIARSIYNKGLKANLFFTQPFEDGLKKLTIEMGKSFALDVEQDIILATKK